jgi:hypothetical protein
MPSVGLMPECGDMPVEWSGALDTGQIWSSLGFFFFFTFLLLWSEVEVVKKDTVPFNNAECSGHFFVRIWYAGTFLLAGRGGEGRKMNCVLFCAWRTWRGFFLPVLPLGAGWSISKLFSTLLWWEVVGRAPEAVSLWNKSGCYLFRICCDVVRLLPAGRGGEGKDWTGGVFCRSGSWWRGDSGAANLGSKISAVNAPSTKLAGGQPLPPCSLVFYRCKVFNL